MTGHWEIMGLRTEKPFITFTETGFPTKFIEELETYRPQGHRKTEARAVLLDELGEEEIATGHMIVYTSADSVLQICAMKKPLT